jgi:hypothetical protein
MASDPKKSRRTAPQGVEYQPGPSQEDQSGEPKSAQDGTERRDVETDTESKEDSV